jgi:hypothetical protein
MRRPFSGLSAAARRFGLGEAMRILFLAGLGEHPPLASGPPRLVVGDAVAILEGLLRSGGDGMRAAPRGVPGDPLTGVSGDGSIEGIGDFLNTTVGGALFSGSLNKVSSIHSSPALSSSSSSVPGILRPVKVGYFGSFFLPSTSGAAFTKYFYNSSTIFLRLFPARISQLLRAKF